jgi:amidohydrolase
VPKVLINNLTDASGAVMDVTILKKKISGLLREILVDMTALCERLYFQPELGYEEHESSRLISGYLRNAGYRVEQPFSGLETSFRAVLSGHRGRSSPRIAILAEYDALPGIGHGCGHNFISACTTGAAIALASVLPFLKGSVEVIGCPAEEGGVEGAGGKVIIIENNGLDGIDAALMVHPSNRTVIHARTTGRVALKIEFFGEAAYASGMESSGVNALESAISAFNAWKTLRSEFNDKVRIHGVITKGGEVPNIVPEYSEVKVYVRAVDPDYLQRGEQRVKECAEEAARQIGATVRFAYSAHTYESIRSNSVLGEVFKRNLEDAGIRVDEPTYIGSGSSDMGNVSRIVPAIQPYVAICDSHIALHTLGFARATMSTRSRKALLDCTWALAATVIDLISFPSTLAQAKDEFNKESEVRRA